MKKEKLVIGTRGSHLALWQAEAVKNALSTVTDIPVVLKVITTRGDERLEIALHSHTLSKGLFTEELEKELLSQEIDFAVHSLKDLPVASPKGLLLGGVLERADVRDALLLHQPQEHPISLAGMRVGTSSPRRVAQLQSSHLATSDTHFEPIRGNVATRIDKLRSGAYDATILALAGLERLGLTDEADHILPLDIMLPAPGQGAIAVQCAEENPLAVELAAKISHPDTQVATYIERRLLQNLGGGCALPLGAFCEIEGKTAHLSVAYTPSPSHPLFRNKYTLPLDERLEEALSQVAKELGNR